MCKEPSLISGFHRSGFYFAQNFDENKLENLLDEGLSVHTNVSATPITKVNVFKSDFNFFVGAAVIELGTILAILFTFWGYWNIGRAASFSPLEIAKVSVRLISSVGRY